MPNRMVISSCVLGVGRSSLTFRGTALPKDAPSSPTGGSSKVAMMSNESEVAEVAVSHFVAFFWCRSSFDARAVGERRWCGLWRVCCLWSLCYGDVQL